MPADIGTIITAIIATNYSAYKTTNFATYLSAIITAF